MNGAPTPRCGDPNKPVGAAILLLSKKASGYMTGSAVHVDGGFACSQS